MKYGRCLGRRKREMRGREEGKEVWKRDDFREVRKVR